MDGSCRLHLQASVWIDILHIKEYVHGAPFTIDLQAIMSFKKKVENLFKDRIGRQVQGCNSMQGPPTPSLSSIHQKQCAHSTHETGRVFILRFTLALDVARFH